MQQSKIDGFFDKNIYGTLALDGQVNYKEYYPYTYTPGVLRPVKKKAKVNRKFNLVTATFVLAMIVFVGMCILPFAYKNFFVPIVTNPNALPFRVNLEQIYAPTTKYLHNNEFLGVNTLKGAEVKRPAMDSIHLTAPMTNLESSLNNLAKEYPSIHPSVFVWDCETGRYASLNSSETFPAASIIKIPVLLQFFRSVEAGQHTIADKMTLTDYYRAEGSGDLQFQRAGNQYSMDYLAQKMIQISDNSSTNMLMSSIGGMNDINRALKSWGLQNTEVNNWLPDLSGTNVTTTEDLVRMLYNVENDRFLSETSKAKIFEYMGHVKNNRLIHAGLDPRAKFFHKTGDIGHMLGDAGIVVTPDGHKYIVAILARRPYNSPAGKEFTVRASSVIYNAVSTRNLQ